MTLIWHEDKLTQSVHKYLLRLKCCDRNRPHLWPHCSGSCLSWIFTVYCSVHDASSHPCRCSDLFGTADFVLTVMTLYFLYTFYSWLLNGALSWFLHHLKDKCIPASPTTTEAQCTTLPLRTVCLSFENLWSRCCFRSYFLLLYEWNFKG